MLKKTVNIKNFIADEAGSLLVFFAICAATLLSILALSFDLGRRASTQTDMQSFADNVALAAAKELDGQPDAITRATLAATTVISAANEQLKAGTGGSTLTITFDPVADLRFYKDLPDHDLKQTVGGNIATDFTAAATAAALATRKYTLPPSTTLTAGTGKGKKKVGPEDMQFVGVVLDTIDVEWAFNGLFGSQGEPDPGIAAVAIAGNVGYTCDIAPLMVCLPRSGGVTSDLEKGQSVLVRTSKKDAAWNPGQFGFLDISEIPIDAQGDCAGISNEAKLQACLLAAKNRVSACFNNRGADIQTGQRQGQETAVFNLPFGIFGQSMNGLSSNPVYVPGPHAISGFRLKEQGPNCTPDTDADTMAFPLDDCFYDINGNIDANGCGGTRFGDKNWTNGRQIYNDTNYTVWNENFDPDDPVANAARTVAVGAGGVALDGDWFDFPDANLTRYEYYLKEIERAENGGVITSDGSAEFKYREDGTGPTPGAPGDFTSYNSWDDFWPDSWTTGYPAIIPDTHNRVDNGLAQCPSVTQGGQDARRRVVTIAGIECPEDGEPDRLTGNEEDVAVHSYYEVFLLRPVDETSGTGQEFDIWIEVIEKIGTDAGETLESGIFREVIQLYK